MLTPSSNIQNTGISTISNNTIPQTAPITQNSSPMHKFLHIIKMELHCQGIDIYSPEGKSALEKEIIESILQG